MTVRRACSSAPTKRFIAPSVKAEIGWYRKPLERSFAVRHLHLTIAFANRCATFICGNQKQSAIAFQLLKPAREGVAHRITLRSAQVRRISWVRGVRPAWGAVRVASS